MDLATTGQQTRRLALVFHGVFTENGPMIARSKGGLLDGYNANVRQPTKWGPKSKKILQHFPSSFPKSHSLMMFDEHVLLGKKSMAHHGSHRRKNQATTFGAPHWHVGKVEDQGGRQRHRELFGHLRHQLHRGQTWDENAASCWKRRWNKAKFSWKKHGPFFLLDWKMLKYRLNVSWIFDHLNMLGWKMLEKYWASFYKSQWSNENTWASHCPYPLPSKDYRPQNQTPAVVLLFLSWQIHPSFGSKPNKQPTKTPTKIGKIHQKQPPLKTFWFLLVQNVRLFFSNFFNDQRDADLVVRRDDVLHDGHQALRGLRRVQALLLRLHGRGRGGASRAGWQGQ